MRAILRAIQARAEAKVLAERERIEAAATCLLDEREAAARRSELEAQITEAEAVVQRLREMAAA